LPLSAKLPQGHQYFNK